MLRLTRRYPFSASHRLHVEGWSDEENRALFGKCNNPYGHGHNYLLHLTISGEPSADTGMLIARDELDRIAREAVLDRIDRKDMNAAVPEFRELVPTTENLAKVIADWLCQAWRARFAEGGPRLNRILLEETGRNTFELKLET